MSNLLDRVREGAGTIRHGSNKDQEWLSDAPAWAPNLGDIKGEIHVRHIVWPGDPYGFDHAKGTMEAATHVADSLGIKGRDLDIVRYAALFHDLGRAGYVADGDIPDAGKEVQLANSSEKAGEGVICQVVAAALAKSPPGSLPYDDEEWQEEVVRLVLALHGEGLASLEGDLRLVALRDAEVLEEGRFWREKTFEHVRASYTKLISPWARERPTQVRWLKRYGIG